LIPLMLQDFLVAEVKSLFDGFTLKNVKGEEVPLHVYPQYLPSKKGQKDTDHYPFIIVKLFEGEDPNEEDPNKCGVLFYCGVFDDSEDYQGYRDSINIIQKLYTHLMTNRFFDNKYEINYPIKWSVTEEDYFSYYFAGLETNWIIGKVTMQEDDFV